MSAKKPWMLLATMFFVFAIGLTVVGVQSSITLSEYGALLGDRDFIALSIKRMGFMVLTALNLMAAWAFFIYGLYEK